MRLSYHTRLTGSIKIPRNVKGRVILGMNSSNILIGHSAVGKSVERKRSIGGCLHSVFPNMNKKGYVSANKEARKGWATFYYYHILDSFANLV
jgi:hypothetical protein